MPSRIIHRLGAAKLGLGLLVLAAACSGSARGSEEVPLPETTPFSPEVEARLHGIRDKTMEIRGLKVESRANEGMLTRDQLKDYYAEVEAAVTEQERREFEAYNSAMRLLHIIGPEDDLLALSSTSGGEYTLGFFAHADNKLVLVGDGSALSRDDEETLAHEYAHSLQFAAFDVDRLYGLVEKEAKNKKQATEYTTTISCLLEGDAELTEALYEELVLGEESDPTAKPPASPVEPPALPAGYARYMYFDYQQCPDWAASLFIQYGGWDELNKAYRTPPWTTEQILHPEKYVEREGPTRMAPIDLSKRLGKGWRQLWSGIFGEFDVYNHLFTVGNDDMAARIAAAGWGVGWIGVYGEKHAKDVPLADQRALVHVALELDTEADFAEFALVYDAIVRQLSSGAAQISQRQGSVCWNSDIEDAYVAWDQEQRRIDILLATDEESLQRAAAGTLSTGTGAPCAAQ